MSKNTFQSIEGTFLSSADDKTALYYKHFIPAQLKDAPIIHLFFQHGMIEYHKRHEEFFQFLLDHFSGNLILSTMDLYGHGYSGGTRADISKFEIFTQDMFNFIELSAKEFHLPERDYQTVLMGHSLGGLVILKMLEEYKKKLNIKINKLIFVNPCISPEIAIPKKVESQLNETIPSVMKSIQVPVIYNGEDITSEQEKIETFTLDPLISKSISIRLALETIKATHGIHSLSYFMSIPSLFLLSGDDRVVSLDRTQLFVTGMDKEIVETRFYSTMKHDLLNETCRIEVFKEIITYLKKSKGLK